MTPFQDQLAGITRKATDVKDKNACTRRRGSCCNTYRCHNFLRDRAPTTVAGVHPSVASSRLPFAPLSHPFFNTSLCLSPISSISVSICLPPNQHFFCLNLHPNLDKILHVDRRLVTCRSPLLLQKTARGYPPPCLANINAASAATALMRSTSASSPTCGLASGCSRDEPRFREGRDWRKSQRREGQARSVVSTFGVAVPGVTKRFAGVTRTLAPPTPAPAGP